MKRPFGSRGAGWSSGGLRLGGLLGLVTLATGAACVPAGRANPQFYSAGRWQGISGPVRIHDVVICHNARARGVDDELSGVEEHLVPEIARGLRQDPATVKARRLPSGTGLCSALAQLVSDQYDVPKTARREVKAELAKCPDCKSVVIPTVFVAWSEERTIYDAQGRPIASTEGGIPTSDGNLYTRMYVFTADGALAFNGYSEANVARGNLETNFRVQSPEIVKAIMSGFPAHVLDRTKP